MKKLFKVGCLGIIALVVLGIIAGIMTGGGSDTKTTDSAPKVEAEKAPQDDAKVTQANFDKITQGDSLTGSGGMTIDQVKAILGEPSTTSQSKTGDMTMDDYMWTENFKSIAVNFTNGKVSFKQFMK